MVTANSFAEVAALVTAEPQLLPPCGEWGAAGERTGPSSQWGTHGPGWLWLPLGFPQALLSA